MGCLVVRRSRLREGDAGASAFAAGGWTKRGYRVDIRGKKPHCDKWGARPKGKGPGGSRRRIRYRNKHMGFPHVQYYRGGKAYGKWAYRPGLRHVWRAWRSL